MAYASKCMKLGGRDESAFSRLLDRLPDTDMYDPDAYPVYEWLVRDRHAIGKGGALNRMMDCAPS